MYPIQPCDFRIKEDHFIFLQLEAALTMDAVNLMVGGINRMLTKNPEVFKGTFRRGQVYNNGSRGIQCKNDPPIPWKHGPDITNAIRSVRFCFLHNIY